ncbi:Hydroxyacylglutathione hydrolase, mitochondrial [Psilocybe cubensis]|uniref:hydroxyacylglutathione hydrolase n=2 Tax=Psilocybe cubensis TaxID=181762 RepID=A0A8H7Y2U7_PSICU|nr:Hydroxyacylglutathione hydrolase, mitochondrial [Psilocybe cubensis]KAH9484162.1 Hydroxyacylglutathione hydrolase, mitochondrial [Psilocybe cubensis]
MKVVPVPVREDNYAYLLIDESTNKAAAVDPYDVPKVAAAAHEHGVEIVAGITTHHHFDHSGGNKEFASKYPDAFIYGGSDKVPALTNLVKDKDEFTIGNNIRVKCLATPCHTQESICYYVTDAVEGTHPGGVFTGDTLFIAGCGRFFEGVGAEMVRALDYLETLPPKTIVYNGHEYTAGSLAFGKHIDPENPALARLQEITRNNKITTGLTTIADEKEWNVFMRLESDAVRKATSATSDTPKSAIMDALREQKNKFKG